MCVCVCVIVSCFRLISVEYPALINPLRPLPAPIKIMKFEKERGDKERVGIEIGGEKRDAERGRRG